MELRDSLFKQFGTKFTSSHSDHGRLDLQLLSDDRLDVQSTQRIRDSFFELKNDFRFHMLLNISFNEVLNERVLYYQLINLEVHFKLTVCLPLSQSDFFASVADVWPGSYIFEQEIIKRHGMILSSGKASEQRKMLIKRNEEAQKKNSLEVVPLPQYKMPIRPSISQRNRKWHRMGPFGAPFKGAMRVDYLLDENKVYDAKIHTGLSHKSFEKIVSKKNIFESLSLFEKLCIRDSIFAPLLWVEAMESRFAIDVPDKACAMRMVWMELARVEGHLHFLKNLTQDLGYYVEASVFSELIEQVIHLYNLNFGKSQNFSLFSFGGVSRSFPIGWSSECLEVAKYILKTLDQTAKDLIRNAKWMQVTGHCPMNAGLALDYGLTGPNLRACGVNFDARKSRPTYFYNDVDFDVPLGVDGTNYDRFLVRLEELKQSLRIINQVLDHLPAGEHLNREHELHDPLGDRDHKQCVSNIDYRDQMIRPGNTYSSIESTEGELGLILHVTQSSTVEHLHIRSPSLSHICAYPELIKSQSLENAFVAYASLCIDAWEMDR